MALLERDETLERAAYCIGCSSKEKKTNPGSINTTALVRTSFGAYYPLKILAQVLELVRRLELVG